MLLTAAAGFYLGSRAGVEVWLLVHTLVGVALVAAGTNAFNQVREPFPVDRLAQAAAEATLDDEAYVRAAFENNRAGRAWLAGALSDMGLEVIPSQANFVLADLDRPADEVARQLLPHGVIVRPGAMWRLPTWVRISVGTAEENRRVIAALKTVLTGR